MRNYKGNKNWLTDFIMRREKKCQIYLSFGPTLQNLEVNFVIAILRWSGGSVKPGEKCAATLGVGW